MKAINLILLCLFSHTLMAQIDTSKTIYLIPGTGADGHLFEHIHIEKYDTVWLEYILPKKKENFSSYIDRMASKIDTTERYAIVGVSLGGMIATELADRLNPEEVVVIAGAKTKSELPDSYHIFRYIPLHRIMGGRSMIWGTKLVQPIFEPMDENNQAAFRLMLSRKSPKFIKSAVRWMIQWDRTDYRADIVHIHGEKDHTLPIRNVKADYIIEDGGHMITYNRADEISSLLNQIIK